MRLTGLRYGTLTADATADLGTTADGTQLGGVRVRSSLGTPSTETLRTPAASSPSTVACNRRSRNCTPSPETSTRAAASTAACASSPTVRRRPPCRRVNDLQFHDARVAGVPVRAITATATLRDQRLDVRSLQARIAGGTVTVQGALGNGGELQATSSALALPAPAGGTLRANARVRGTLAAPDADVTALVEGAKWGGMGLAGNAFAHYDRGTLHVNEATALVLDSYATAAGDVRGLDGSGPKTLDLTAALHGTQIAPLAKALRLPLRYPEGELDADLRVTGLADAPQIAGLVRIPRGSLNAD